MGKLKFDLEKAKEILDSDCQESEMICTIQETGQAALDRIAELEGHLCEAEARSLHNFQRYGAVVNNRHLANPVLSWDDMGEDERELRIEIARKMLHCEGKL